ncbi:MAG TPA: cytochrome c-type biogenesis protein CcmH [Gemmatimonadaceae bacterium]
MRRRDFIARAASGGAALIAVQSVRAQQSGPAQGNTSNLFDMDQEAAQTVRRAPKPGARAQVTDEQRDALERQLRCQCGCTLDVYICRTTDFSCQVSPAMHRDVIALVQGGYSAQEIIDAFVQTYGEKVLMSPKREGFNWAGYVVPFAAIAVGAVALIGVLQRMRRRSVTISAASPDALDVVATPEELAHIEAAIHRDD